MSELETTEYLDDDSYIKAVAHGVCGFFHQYDVLLAARGYGWKYMLDAAEYLAAADLRVENVTSVPHGGVGDENLTEEYKSNGSFLSMPSLSNERASLGVAGTSKVLKELGFSGGQGHFGVLKVVWLNQTKILRFFVLEENEELIRKYAESLIRRNFGTADEMKTGRPIGPIQNMAPVPLKPSDSKVPEVNDQGKLSDLKSSGTNDQAKPAGTVRARDTVSAGNPARKTDPETVIRELEEKRRQESIAANEKGMKLVALGFVIVTILFFVFIFVFMT